MKKNFTLLILLLSFATVIAKEQVSFNYQVKPILSDKCFFCHGPDQKNREAKLRLDTKEGAYKALKKGMFPVKPGDLKHSTVWERINTDDEDDVMPPLDSNLKLTAKEKDIIKKWIEQGADYQKHWAFVKVADKIDVPQVNTPQGNEVDAFVQQDLKENKLTSAPEANKEILLRRLKFTLTGLPPTENEINSFLNDSSKNAYEKRVDQFLKSPATAERIAVDWMDLSRFADTYGFQQDWARDMSLWRDWVLKAINENMPYDKFITWQLAGDLIPKTSRDSILATAFNRHNQQKNEGGTVEEEFRVEYVADRTHTAGTAFMGLTFECARCHDHKYDPLPTKDYYRLFAFFNNIDESGIYSYFTKSTPTPTLALPNKQQKQAQNKLRTEIAFDEKKMLALHDSEKEAFNQWLKTKPELKVTGKIGSFTFDDHKEGLKNQIKGKPNGSGKPQIIDGMKGKAFKMSGDNNVSFKFGALNRSNPRTLHMALKVPQKMPRAVIVHRSKAWTDAASRGYELLLEDGKLSWAYIHFWPGNAIRVKSQVEVPLNKWFNVTISYDGSSKAQGLKIYMNGELLKTDIIRDNLTKEIHYNGGNPNIMIGARMRDRGFTNGGIDNFMVFNRQLSALEIKSLSQKSALKESLAKKDPKLYEYYLNNHNKNYQSALSDLQTKRLKYNKLLDKNQEIMVMKELATRRKTYVLTRGLYSTPDLKQPVRPTPPSEIMAFDSQLPKNRLGLAKWLTDTNNPLTARVAINRYWKMVFGKGIVTTPDDFGSQGALPSHPELLDWLAREFMNRKWNIKSMLKLMVMSQTFKQRSSTSLSLMQKDPTNKYLSYGPRHRLSAEMIRDQALFAAQTLQQKLGGRSEQSSKSFRRGLYLYWKRNDPPPAMLIFDAPRRQVCSVKRESTSTPLQALVLLNNDLYVRASKSIADKALKENEGNKEQTLNSIFRRLTGRQAKANEKKILFELLSDQLKYFQNSKQKTTDFLKYNSPRVYWKNKEELAAWSIIASTIMNLDATITLR